MTPHVLHISSAALAFTATPREITTASLLQISPWASCPVVCVAAAQLTAHRLPRRIHLSDILKNRPTKNRIRASMGAFLLMRLPNALFDALACPISPMICNLHQDLHRLCEHVIAAFCRSRLAWVTWAPSYVHCHHQVHVVPRLAACCCERIP